MPPDHPRSRGVYVPVHGAVEVQEGSSPLARGLLPVLSPDIDDGGIIPARAGFTRTTTRSPTRYRDHPRSRGVYLCLSSGVRACRGSSPLARGLQPVGLRYSRDHPRSRGVYYEKLVPDSRYCGSSPLARGLHCVDQCLEIHCGIIPARAGFTPAGSWPRVRAPDHPRSRGVYFRFLASRCFFRGSSPLARGLRRRRDHLGHLLGIIPARAGFTLRSRSHPGPRTDHPRSRGVYELNND